MRAYWFDNVPGDQREPHDSGRPVDAAQLGALGILSFHFAQLETVDDLARQRGYKNRDTVTISPRSLGAAYDAKVRSFFHEHLHEDEEIRYIVDGAGYFDVRAHHDAWLRVRLEKHDLMILPAGIYHRFTTDTDNYTVAMRLFQDEPKWTPLNRGAMTDDNPFRKQYLAGQNLAGQTMSTSISAAD